MCLVLCSPGAGCPLFPVLFGWCCCVWILLVTLLIFVDPCWSCCKYCKCCNLYILYNLLYLLYMLYFVDFVFLLLKFRCVASNSINPHWCIWCAPLAGCRCCPCHCDDMPHDALMWGHGEDLVDRSGSCAPMSTGLLWGQPQYRWGQSGRPVGSILLYVYKFYNVYMWSDRSVSHVSLLPGSPFIYFIFMIYIYIWSIFHIFHIFYIIYIILHILHIIYNI